MAKIVEDVIVIKLSKLVKNNDTADTNLIGEETLMGLEAVIQELVSSDVIVEVSTDYDN